MTYSEHYADYKWIKVPKHEAHPMKTDFDNYVDLEQHHIAETTFLIEEVRKLAKLLDGFQRERDMRAAYAAQVLATPLTQWDD